MTDALAMESRSRPSNRWFHAAMAGLLALAIAVQVVRDRGWRPYEPTTPVLWFQSGPLLKRISLGFDNLLADVYWMRAVVYYGSKRRSDEKNRNFDLLDPFLTLVTNLDPQFKIAYRFGAIFLTEGYPLGPGRPDLAIGLLERGIAANPHAWEYPHDIGFVHYWWLHDYRAAAEWFAKASKLPGSAEWLAPLAASTLAQGGDRQASRFLWRQLLQSNDADWLRQNAERSLAQLDAMDVIDELNRISQRYTAREGRPPQTWRDLVTGERLRGIPPDPTGTPFVLDPATGRIGLSRQSALWPLPTEQAGAKAGVK